MYNIVKKNRLYTYRYYVLQYVNNNLKHRSRLKFYKYNMTIINCYVINFHYY